MRTTIRIDDELYREVKAEAAREGRPVGEVIEDALRTRHQRLAREDSVPALPVFHGNGVMPGVDLGDNAALLELMDEEAPVDALR